VLAGAALIVDADEAVCTALSATLARLGLKPRVASSLADALTDIDAEPVDVVFLGAAAFDGASKLAEIVDRFDDIPVIVTGSGGAEQAALAIRAGAADFVDTSFDETELAFLLDKVLTSSRVDPAQLPASKITGSGLLGQSKAMAHVLDVVRRVAPGNATVLVRGESGTGKELVARAIHDQSPRSAGPFVKVHCAGLPETLLESELFGYEKGAFTGAAHRKPGRVEIAEGGTLFLDEIGDITPAMQVKLLRLLQDREYERLGGNATLRADVRFVTATHRDLEHMIKKSEFREDLFYRLNVVPVWLPPLRARRDDVPLLIERFCEDFAEAHDKRGISVTAEAIAVLSAERWPGNVRQLQNFVERLVVLAQGKAITAEDARRELAPPVHFATQGSAHTPATERAATGHAVDSAIPASAVLPLDTVLHEAEKRAIERALRHSKGNRTLAARLLGVSRATFYTKLEEHGLAKPKRD
jgi:two-component system response regulator AtoC